jgi:thiamine biosynthesis protein ThiS
MVVKEQVKDYVEAAMMIVFNGEERSCQDGWTLADLVEDLGLTKKRIAAEVNRDIIPREAYGQQRLQAGDVIEIVNFVGGG